MVDHGKRSRSGRDRGRDRGRDANDDRKSQKRRLQNTSSNRNSSNMGNSSEGELVVYRILCPSEHIGSVIGKGGKVINSLRQETNAKIKVVDPYPGCTNRVMMIYCYVHNKDGMDVDENNMKPICASQDALLKVHATIINSVAGFGDSEKKNTVEAKVLAPASQASSIIGKAGCSIKKIRANTNASIKINPKDLSDPSQFCLMNFDNLITITGNVEAVKRALFLISTIMYKTPPREEIPLETTVPELQGSIIIPSDVPFFTTADGFYPGVEAIGSSSRSVAPITDFAGYADPSVAWAPPYPSAMPGVSEFSTPHANELVVRLLCPSDKIGRVIGKGGSSITNMRKVTGARIDVDDRKNNTDECIITITSTESMNDVKSASIEAIWLLQEKINEDDGERVNMRFLVPSKIIGCVIGKGGSIINEIRKATKTEIRISKGDKPKCASSNEELVEIFGELSCLRNAILQIILRLRDDVLRNRENKDASSWNPPPPPVPMYSSSHSLPPVLTSVPPASSLSYDKRTESGNGIGMFKSAGSHYEYNSLQNEDSKYRSQSSYSSKFYGRTPSFYEMTISASVVGKVLGKGGANLINIQKLSGATIEIIESKVSSSELVAQISGTMEQQRMAENMIQAFIMSN